MARQRTYIAPLILLVIGVVGASAAVAEVSVRVDDQGNYLRTIVLANESAKKVKIWTPRKGNHDVVLLNPDGDAAGDLTPIVIENPVAANHPWVIWSAFNGVDYDLAFARWNGPPDSVAPGWLGPNWVESAARAGDDLDADVVLDLEDGGRPYMTWWSDQGGQGVVYFSLYLETKWMLRRRISDAGIDSRYPAISANSDGSFTITFHTPNGTEERIVRIVHSGQSINDSIDPWSNVISQDPTEDPGTTGGVNMNESL